MGAKTGISWCDSTWNPIRGCSRVSEGCRNCYAESTAYRFSGSGQPYEGLAVLKNGHASWTGQVEFVEKHLLDPIHWRTPRKIFVNSMSDLFHENVTDDMRDKIFAVMALCPQHIFQVLTKRPERMLEYFSAFGSGRLDVRSALIGSQFIHIKPKDGPVYEWTGLPLPNVWLGVSVENQAAADERLSILAKTPCRVRFASCEPLLGPLDITRWINRDAIREAGGSWTSEQVDWIIVGGESGPNARPMLSNWADDIRKQCEAARVAFFFKQNGEWIDAGHSEFGKLPSGPYKYLRSDGTEWGDPIPSDEDADVNTVKRVGRTRAGDTLYGKVYHAFPIIGA
jgi:protein gp37